MRLLVGLCVLALAAVLSPGAAADPVAVPFVHFAGVPGESAGSAVAPAGDVNGDGHKDVIIGAHNAFSGSGQDPGGAYVVYGPFVAGTTIDLKRLGDRGFVVRGFQWASAGGSVAGAGDVNGDGLDDVLVGGSREDAPGQAWVIFGRRSPLTVTLATLRANEGITLTGVPHKRLQDGFGGVASLGDIDRDGLDDVGVVAYGAVDPDRQNVVRRGSAYIIFGRRMGATISMAHLGRAGFRIGFGHGTRRAYLQGLSSAGDWNGDGSLDLAVKYDLAHDDAVMGVVYGRRYKHAVNLRRLGSAGLTIRRATAMGSIGGVASGEDLDGDKRPDILIGTPVRYGDPTGGFGKGGGAWVVRGSRTRADLNLNDPGQRAWEIARGDPTPFPGGTAYADAAALGRVNHDRFADAVLLAGGRIAVVYGGPSRETRQLSSLSHQDGFFLASPGEQGFTQAAIAGDMNSDGRADLLAGAPGWQVPNANASDAVYLLFAP